MTLWPAERTTIEAELRQSADALAAGNDGKARVCARRASGTALRSWFREGRITAPADAQSLLKLASTEPRLPFELRQAAERLSTSVTDREILPFSDDPVGDARLIVDLVESIAGRRDV